MLILICSSLLCHSALEVVLVSVLYSPQYSFTLAASLLILLATRYGLGKHVSAVSAEDLSIVLKVRNVEYVLNGGNDILA